MHPPALAHQRQRAHHTNRVRYPESHIYRPSIKSAKAGVMLIDLQPTTRKQLTLDFDEVMPDIRVCLMQAMDEVNQRYGRGTLNLASVGIAGRHRAWNMKQACLSSGLTTDWAGLAVVGR